MAAWSRCCSLVVDRMVSFHREIAVYFCFLEVAEQHYPSRFYAPMRVYARCKITCRDVL
jgi:hypothetical protein